MGYAILGILAVCMISAEVGRREIEQVDVKVKKKVFYINKLDMLFMERNKKK